MLLIAGFSAESPSGGAGARTGVGSRVDVGTLSFELASVVDALFSARGVVSTTGTAEGTGTSVGVE